MSDPEEEPKKKTDKNVFVNGILSALDKFSDASPALRGLVVILAIVAIVALAFGLGFLAKGDSGSGYALTSFIAFAVLASISMFLFWRIVVGTGASNGLARPAASMTQTWSRVVLSNPLDGGTVDDLRKELEMIRTNVFALLQELKQTSIQPSDLRANIFLPDYNRAGNGYVCCLTMLPRLRVNMDGHPDEDIQLRPGQGCTGKVFVEELPHFGVTLDKGDGHQEWDDIYQLTSEQKRQIHPELRWIVSTPLNVVDAKTRKSKTAGVLNVDCLRNRLDSAILRQVSAYMLVAVGTEVQPKIEQLKKVRLVVGVEEII